MATELHDLSIAELSGLIAARKLSPVELVETLIRRVEQYDAQTAERWGLVNRVVPLDELHEAAQEWGERIASFSPTALRFLKHAFNADSAQIGGIARVAYAGLDLFAKTSEANEGAAAFAEKRSPDFERFRRE